MTRVSRGRALVRIPSPHQVGFMKNGKVVALKVEHYSNAGNTMDLSQSVSARYPCILGVGVGWGVTGGSRASPTATLAWASSVPACYCDGNLPTGPHPRVPHPWVPYTSLISKAQR